MHKELNFPASGQSVAGFYEAKVMEPRGLAGLRRKAFRIAGLVGEYDGSISAYRSLRDQDAQLHDKVLSRLVKRNARKFMRSRRDSIQVSTTGVKRNLVLDQGVNKMLRSSGTISWSTFSVYCAAGTGTTPTYTDSGATTATSAGTTVTASGAFFTAAMVGQLIKFDSGEERYITAQASTTCTINSSLTIGSPTLFTVWAVNQLGLASESKRTSTYLTGSGNCGSSWASNVWSGLRTYDFTAEVGNVNYTELGWSDLSASAANLNSRTLISGGTVSVLIGQQLRVVYTIVVTVTPNSTTPGTYAITGWPIAPSVGQDGDYIICTPSSSISPTINTSGVATGDGLFPLCRKSTASHTLGTGSTLPTFGNSYSAGTTANSNTDTYTSYTDNTFFVDLQGVFNLGTGNRTDWRGVYTGPTSGYVFVWDENQTKASTFTLTIRTRMTIGRPLTNP